MGARSIGGQEEVEKRLQSQDLLLDAWLDSHKKKQREMAKFICARRKLLPRYRQDAREELWKKIDA